MREVRSIPITGQYLEHLLHYEPDTGIFRRKLHGELGQPCGSVTTWGYRQIKLMYEGKQFHLAAHRLAWVWMNGEWPKNEIDHINGDKLDNRICNLREATRSQNQAAVRRHRDSTQPYKGVQQLPSGRWRATITINYKRKHIGVFDTPEQAKSAYSSAAKKLYGEFARVA